MRNLREEVMLLPILCKLNKWESDGELDRYLSKAENWNPADKA